MKGKFNKIIYGDKPVLVDFYATWCGPCKAMPPILNKVKDEIGDQLRIIKINIDKNQLVTQQFRVQGVPTLILFKNGRIEWRQSGVVQASQIMRAIKPHLN